MQKKEILKIAFSDKSLTYILILATLFLIYESQWNYLVAHKLTNGITTSLTSADLLVVAGLTITFYTLLHQVIDRTLGKDEKYEIIEKMSSVLILINILFVAISIILILISSLGVDSLRMTGFYYLIESWVYNVIIMFFVLVSPLIEKVLKKDGNRLIFNVIFSFSVVGNIVMLVFFPS